MRPLIITLVTAALILGTFLPADACPVRQRSVKRVVEQQVLLQEAPVYVAPQIISAPVKFRVTQRLVAPEVYSLEQPQIILQQGSFDHCHVGAQSFEKQVFFQNVRNVRAPVVQRSFQKQVNVQGERFPLIAAALRGTARVATAPLRLAANTAAALSAPRQQQRVFKRSVEFISVR